MGQELIQILESIPQKDKKLYQLVSILRAYCEWDKKQTFQSLAPSLLEEAYEIIQGIQTKEKTKKASILKEELGDMLFLIFFYIYLGEEENLFTLNDVYDFLFEKYISRHPHVFGDKSTKDTDIILKNWESFKKKEIGENTEFLPALMRAQKIQKQASLEGFDWIPNENKSHLKEILQKIKEEIQEIETVLSNEKDKEKLETEIGDLLFSVVNLARHVKISAELALHKSIEKFLYRFQKVMSLYQEKYPSDLPKEEKLSILEEIYQQVKKNNEDST